MRHEIRIEFSNPDTPDTIIEELMKIEQDVYLPEYRGEYQSIKNRFYKYKEMFVLVYDGEEIIGYLCFFPVSKSLHDSIVKECQFHDDDILPEDIVAMDRHSHIFLMSIAIYRSYQGMGIGKLLMDAFFNRLKLEKAKGHYVEDIIASVVSPRGELLARRYGFSMVNDLSEIQHHKLFYYDGGML